MMRSDRAGRTWWRNILNEPVSLPCSRILKLDVDMFAKQTIPEYTALFDKALASPPHYIYNQCSDTVFKGRGGYKKSVLTK